MPRMRIGGFDVGSFGSRSKSRIWSAGRWFATTALVRGERRGSHWLWAAFPDLGLGSSPGIRLALGRRCRLCGRASPIPHCHPRRGAPLLPRTVEDPLPPQGVELGTESRRGSSDERQPDMAALSLARGHGGFAASRPEARTPPHHTRLGAAQPRASDRAAHRLPRTGAGRGPPESPRRTDP